MEIRLTAIPVIALLMVALAIYSAWAINKGRKSMLLFGDGRARVSFVMGILVCLVGAYLMAFGEGLLGENHTGIATIIGIVGIGLIGTSGAMFAAHATNVRKEENLNGGKPLE